MVKVDEGEGPNVGPLNACVVYSESVLIAHDIMRDIIADRCGRDETIEMLKKVERLVGLALRELTQ